MMNAIHRTSGVNALAELRRLADTVPFLHHQVLRQKLASLNRAIQRLAQNHVVPLPVMDRFEREFLAMADNVETNLEDQECWLFAWLNRIGKEETASNYLAESLEEAMTRATSANQEALDGIGQIEMYLCGPDWTEKGLLVEALIDHLRDLEEELVEYNRLEREELFPRVRAYSQSCMQEEMDHDS
jgi:regulator of cell morphogenesis and NO signaling